MKNLFLNLKSKIFANGKGTSFDVSNWRSSEKVKQIGRIVLFLAIATGMFFYAKSQGFNFGTKADVIGNLKFTYPNGTTPETLFNELDFKPGDCKEVKVSVENLSDESNVVGVFSDGEFESDGLSSALTIVITDGTNILYGPVTLAQFFADSDIENQIMLKTLAGHGTTDLFFKVCFTLTDDNELQGDTVVFDLKFGDIDPPIDLPEECAHLAGTITSVIEGTEGDDDLHGNIQNNLILAYGGNDTVDASSGNDCIVLGDGDDKVDAESGNDVILGGNGNDKIRSGSGNDIVYGGEGDDDIDLGSGNDKAWGGGGDDDIDGGSGLDEIYGGSGLDELRGGSSADKIYGEEGNDDIHGGSGNDYLDGGPGTDDIRGNFDTDTCVNGESYSSCEL